MKSKLPKKKEKSKLSSGFDSHLKRLSKRAHVYIADCANCKFDVSGECSNTNVTNFDMVHDDERVFCSYWQMNVK